MIDTDNVDFFTFMYCYWTDNSTALSEW